MITKAILAVLLGYVLGAIPFGLILTKLAGTDDLRSIGSGNIGATNVLRTGRKGLAALTLLLDGAKGFFAVWLTQHVWSLSGSPILGGFAGLGALLGHCFPVWLGFKGGKGVATMLGVSLGLSWLIGLICLATWLIVALLTRISSLGGMTSAVAAPLAAYAVYHSVTPTPWIGSPGLYIQVPILIVMALIVLINHRANIMRLRAGTEPRIGQKS